MNETITNPEVSRDYRWEFIEKHLPGYYQDEGVAWSNDLAKYIDGEYDYTDPDDLARINEIAELCPTMEDAFMELERIDCELYLEALKHYKAELAKQHVNG